MKRNLYLLLGEYAADAALGDVPTSEGVEERSTEEVRDALAKRARDIGARACADASPGDSA